MGINIQYVWLLWSLLLLVVWGLVYFALKNKQSRREMLLVSLATSGLGLIEPLYVPEYWSPPSLFDLARRTGFDVESLIFAFAVAGLAVVLYELLQPVRHQTMPESEKHSRRHRYHRLALLTGPIVFILLIIYAPINPIYSTILATLIGGLATWWCRPDLKKKMLLSAAIFTALYFVYFETNSEVFTGLLYPTALDNVDNMKTEIIKKLKDLYSIPVEKYSFEWKVNP